MIKNQLLEKYIENNKEFLCCDLPVSSNLEITKVMHLLEKEKGKRPTVLFEHVDDKEIPVLMNPFKKSMLYQSICKDAPFPQQELRKRYREKNHEKKYVKPDQLVKLNGLDDLPILYHQPQDGGRYINAGVTALRNPENDAINLGIYRIQVINNKKALVFMNHSSHGYQIYQKQLESKKEVPVVIFIGAEMVYYVLGAAKYPKEEDNYDIATRLLQNSIELYDFDIPVPSEAQFIIKGKLLNQTEEEGPFAEFKGFYCDPVQAPILEVSEVYSAKDPFYVSIVAGKESGLSIMGVQGEIMMYDHLISLGYDIGTVQYRLEESGEFVALIECKNPTEELVHEALSFDQRLKIIISGEELEDPWNQLVKRNFDIVSEDCMYRGKQLGKKVGFLLKPNEAKKKVEIF